MNDVKWIKISTGIFDDEKINLIKKNKKIKKSDSILIIYFQLLVLAGKKNNSGIFKFNDEKPLTPDMLATLFDRTEKEVAEALRVLEDYGLIENIQGFVTIPTWEKYQNLDAYEQKKERDREYQRVRREMQKDVVKKSPTNRLTKSDNRSLEEEIDIDIDKDIKKNIKKKTFGDYQHVTLSDDEYERLVNDYPDISIVAAIQKLDEYMEQTGRKYKSCYLAMKNWVYKSFTENKGKGYDWENV